MTSTLTDRYVAATVRRVPQKHRREIERELRAAIADDIEARVELGQTPADAEYAALAELGDPARLATRYAGGTRALIGPDTYPFYVRVVRLACATVLSIVYVVNDIGYWVRGDSVGQKIFGPIGVTLTAAMYLLVAVTAFFVLVDRFANDGRGGAEGDEWTPEHLPSALQPSRWATLGRVLGRKRRRGGEAS